jgi:hypothetical protein
VINPIVSDFPASVLSALSAALVSPCRRQTGTRAVEVSTGNQQAIESVIEPRTGSEQFVIQVIIPDSILRAAATWTM